MTTSTTKTTTTTTDGHGGPMLLNHNGGRPFDFDNGMHRSAVVCEQQEELADICRAAIDEARLSNTSFYDSQVRGAPSSPPNWSLCTGATAVHDDWFVPSSLSEIVGNESAVRTIDRWLGLWTVNPPLLPRRCAMLVRGPPGCGKSTAVRIALQKHGFENVIEINASDVRNKRLIAQRLIPILQTAVVHGKNGVYSPRTAVVLEEVDGGTVRSAPGGGALSGTSTGAASRGAPNGSESSSSRGGRGRGSGSVLGRGAASYGRGNCSRGRTQRNASGVHVVESNSQFSVSIERETDIGRGRERGRGRGRGRGSVGGRAPARGRGKNAGAGRGGARRGSGRRGVPAADADDYYDQETLAEMDSNVAGGGCEGGGGGGSAGGMENEPLTCNSFGAGSFSTGGGTVDALVRFLSGIGYLPPRADARGLDPATAPAVGAEKWCPFRSPVPIIMLANDANPAFLRALEDVSLLVRFFAVPEKMMRQRLALDLSVRLNLRWERPHAGDADQRPLYDILVEHAQGDMRKGTSLLNGVVRAAYSRRRMMPTDHPATKMAHLVIKRVDCEAYFGRSAADVADSTPTLFGAARFVLCDAVCACPVARNCTCARSEDGLFSKPLLSKPFFTFAPTLVCSSFPSSTAASSASSSASAAAAAAASTSAVAETEAAKHCSCSASTFSNVKTFPSKVISPRFDENVAENCRVCSAPIPPADSRQLPTVEIVKSEPGESFSVQSCIDRCDRSDNPHCVFTFTGIGDDASHADAYFHPLLLEGHFSDEIANRTLSLDVLNRSFQDRLSGCASPTQWSALNCLLGALKGAVESFCSKNGGSDAPCVSVAVCIDNGVFRLRKRSERARTPTFDGWENGIFGSLGPRSNALSEGQQCVTARFFGANSASFRLKDGSFAARTFETQLETARLYSLVIEKELCESFQAEDLSFDKYSGANAAESNFIVPGVIGGGTANCGARDLERGGGGGGGGGGVGGGGWLPFDFQEISFDPLCKPPSEESSGGCTDGLRVKLKLDEIFCVWQHCFCSDNSTSGGGGGGGGGGAGNDYDDERREKRNIGYNNGNGGIFLTTGPISRETAPNNVGPKAPPTVFEQMQSIASKKMRSLPDMIFENYLLCSPQARRSAESASRIAASTARRVIASYFSTAELIRSDFAYLNDTVAQNVHQQLGMVAPALCVRYPQKYCRLPDGLVVRCGGLERLNLQKSSLDGEQGNSGSTLKSAIRERNAYVQHHALAYQVDLGRWYDADNSISKLDETRSQTGMLWRKTTAASGASSKPLNAASGAGRRSSTAASALSSASFVAGSSAAAAGAGEFKSLAASVSALKRRRLDAECSISERKLTENERKDLKRDLKEARAEPGSVVRSRGARKLRMHDLKRDGDVALERPEVREAAVAAASAELCFPDGIRYSESNGVVAPVEKNNSNFPAEFFGEATPSNAGSGDDFSPPGTDSFPTRRTIRRRRDEKETCAGFCSSTVAKAENAPLHKYSSIPASGRGLDAFFTKSAQ